jgi:GTP-binding protein
MVSAGDDTPRPRSPRAGHLIVAIVGRPNVGKSTLFNRLVGKRLALVDDTPGVTRDRREGEGRLGPLRFRVIDTAGLEDVLDESMEGRMRRQTERAIAEADVCLFLIDARAGVTPLDRHFGRLLRKGETPVVLVANKAEGAAGEAGVLDAYALGLGEAIAISAEHGEGLADLHDALVPFVGRRETLEHQPDVEPTDEIEAAEAGEGEPEKALAIAIVGRPNAGKSTLVNRLLGEERMLTGPEAGLTRDSIAVEWTWGERRVRLFDTAGLRRKARVTGKLEKLSAADTLRAIRFAEVVILLVDAVQGLDRQDLQIASRVVDEGRALVVAVNKWDAAEDRQEFLADLAERLSHSMPQVRGVPVVTISARTGGGLERLMSAVASMETAWNHRVPTAQLNRWLAEALERHPPPAVDGRRLRPRYMTQIKTRPPTFAIFMNRAGELPESYLRYLQNGLRDDFDMPGVPIRIYLRTAENPYAEE